MTGGVTRIDAELGSFIPTSTYDPSLAVDPELLISGTPNDRGAILFTSGDAKVACGLWACDVYSERVPSYPVDELYVVIEGTLVVTVDGQQQERFDPGDAFVIERGTACVLDFQSPFRKFWMTYDPQPLAGSPGPPTA